MGDLGSYETTFHCTMLCNPTCWNTSYDKEEHLADHKSYISSLNILVNKENDDFSSWYWITKLHKNPHTEKNTTGASTFSTNFFYKVIVYKYG